MILISISVDREIKIDWILFWFTVYNSSEREVKSFHSYFERFKLVFYIFEILRKRDGFFFEGEEGEEAEEQ